VTVSVNLNDLFAGPVEVVVATPAMNAAPLLELEAMSVAGAVERRRQEYAAGRAAARAALLRLGHGAPAIPTAPDRSPIWPAGVVGSITHCEGFCAAVVADAAKVEGLGLDAEPNAPLPSDVIDLVSCPGEGARAARALASLDWTRLLFSAKEAFYKGFYPLTRQYLDFRDVVVDFASTSGNRGAYVAALRDPNQRWAGLADRFIGRWILAGDILICGATLLHQDTDAFPKL
jgi:4'-phosphopantetheinyl transferase EntD